MRHAGIARLRREDGGVLAMAAVMIPVFILLTALVVDAGTWFTHKRQLQNRADAGAFAAGVEYAARWAACGDATTKAATETAINLAARLYSGDPDEAAAGTLRNTEVTDQARVNVEINAVPSNPLDPNGAFNPNMSWDDAGVSGAGSGIGPCDPHPADEFSPANSYWVDVKVRERDQLSLFGAFGINLLNNRAQARVELKTAEAGNGFIPIALPDQDIRQAQIRYYRYCGNPSPELLATIPLRSLGSDYQRVSGTTLWGPTLNNQVGGSPVGWSLTIPRDGDCPGTYMSIRAEVRIAGVEPNVVNINTATCAQLVAARYADCWEQVSDFSVENDNPLSEPWFHQVTFDGGTCGPDAYFVQQSVDPPCSYGVRVTVDWNDLANNPPAGRQFTVSVGGATLTPPSGSPNGVWTGSANNTTTGQPTTVSLSWTCTEPDVSTNNPNDRRNCPGAAGGSQSVRSIFHADAQTARIVTMVRTSRSPQQPLGQPGGALHYVPAPQGASSNTITIYPTVGLESSLYVGQRRVLRAPHCRNNTNSQNCDIDTSSPNSSQSVDCEPDTGGQGHDFVMFANGCRPWYSDNSFDPSTVWWPCPNKNGILAQPNSKGTPWECVIKAPGFSPPVIADGIATAIGNCSDLQPNSCRRYQCINPNYYNPAQPNAWAIQPGVEPSPRVVFIFIVPYGAYKNSGPQESLPIINFAAFYVTGWAGVGNGGNQNPCAGADPDGPNQPGRADETTNGGDIVGYFVDYAMPDAPGDPSSVCVIGQLRPCTPVLVR